MEICTAEANDINYHGSDNSHLHLISPYNKYSALQHQNSIKWAQRAHLLCVLDENKNTSFFHNSINIHNHHSMISHITDFNGQVHTDSSNIKLTCINYYRNMWTEPAASNLANIIQDFSTYLPKIFDNDVMLLTRETT